MKLRFLRKTGRENYLVQDEPTLEFLRRHSHQTFPVISPEKLQEMIAQEKNEVEIEIVDERQENIKAFRDILEEADQPPNPFRPKKLRIYSFFRRPSSSWVEGPSGRFYVSLHVVLCLQPFDVTDLAGGVFDEDPCHLYFPATDRTSAEIRLEGRRESEQTTFIRRVSFELYGDRLAIDPILL